MRLQLLSDFARSSTARRSSSSVFYAECDGHNFWCVRGWCVMQRQIGDLQARLNDRSVEVSELRSRLTSAVSYSSCKYCCSTTIITVVEVVFQVNLGLAAHLSLFLLLFRMRTFWCTFFYSYANRQCWQRLSSSSSSSSSSTSRTYWLTWHKLTIWYDTIR